MILDQFSDFFEFAMEAFDGVHGWMQELAALIAFVVVFNFLVKWGLRKLHHHFEKQKKVWHDSFVVALYKPLSYFVWFFACLQALDLISFRVFSEAFVKEKHLVIGISMVLAQAWFLLRWKKNIVQHMILKSKNREITFDQGKIDVIDKLATVTICFFTVLILLEITQRSMNTLIAFGGVGGLALAISAQEIVASFFGGLMIYLTHPFAIGDWVSLPERSIEGIVEEIGWYMTRIRTFEKQPIYIPNSLFSKMVVVNPSRMTHRKIKEIVGIRYCDLQHARAISKEIKEMLQSNPDVDSSQNIIVRLSAFGAYSLDLAVEACIRPVDKEGFTRAKEEILYKVIEIIHQNNADLAFPTSTVEVQQGAPV